MNLAASTPRLPAHMHLSVMDMSPFFPAQVLMWITFISCALVMVGIAVIFFMKGKKAVSWECFYIMAIVCE